MTYDNETVSNEDRNPDEMKTRRGGIRRVKKRPREWERDREEGETKRRIERRREKEEREKGERKRIREREG